MSRRISLRPDPTAGHRIVRIHTGGGITVTCSCGGLYTPVRDGRNDRKVEHWRGVAASHLADVRVGAVR